MRYELGKNTKIDLALMNVEQFVYAQMLRFASNPRRRRRQGGVREAGRSFRPSVEVKAMVRSRVVVVEDEPEMLDIIRVNLEHAGYSVVGTRDGVEACGVLDGVDCDAVILDLGLPRMSGFRLAKLLRRDPKWQGIPVMVVTAFNFEEVEEIADEGIQAFISKPFDPADLVSKLKYVLSRSMQVAARRSGYLTGYQDSRSYSA